MESNETMESEVSEEGKLESTVKYPKENNNEPLSDS